jgi:hypothetical protein
MKIINSLKITMGGKCLLTNRIATIVLLHLFGVQLNCSFKKGKFVFKPNLQIKTEQNLYR